MQADASNLGIGAVIGAIIAGFFAWLTQRNKGQTDTEVAVLAEWAKLNEALSNRLAAVEKEFAEYRQQIAKEFEDLRTRHSNEMDEMRKTHRAEMRAMRELNDGLQRQIAQNSQSAAHLIEDVKRGEGNAK